MINQSINPLVLTNHYVKLKHHKNISLQRKMRERRCPQMAKNIMVRIIYNCIVHIASKTFNVCVYGRYVVISMFILHRPGY